MQELDRGGCADESAENLAPAEEEGGHHRFNTMDRIAVPCLSMAEAEKLQVQACGKPTPKPRTHYYNVVLPPAQMPHSWPLIS